MKAEVVVQRTGEAVRDRMEKLGTLSEAGEVVGHSVGYFSSQLKSPGCFGLDVPVALLSLERMGDPLPGEVLHAAVSQLGEDPALILLAAREHQDLAPDLYFREASRGSRRWSRPGRRRTAPGEAEPARSRRTTYAAATAKPPKKSYRS